MISLATAIVIGTGPKQRKLEMVTFSRRTSVLSGVADRQRLCAFTENREIAAIAEDAATPPPGDFLDYAEPLEIGKRRVYGRR